MLTITTAFQLIYDLVCSTSMFPSDENMATSPVILSPVPLVCQMSWSRPACVVEVPIMLHASLFLLFRVQQQRVNHDRRAEETKFK